jgi:hypothetical protein
VSTVRSADQVEPVAKYAVRRVLSDGSSGEQLEPGTFFVLRSSDLFGPATLWAYAAAIATQIEFSRTRPGSLSPDEVEHLEALEEMVSDLAVTWQRSGAGRVPD